MQLTEALVDKCHQTLAGPPLTGCVTLLVLTGLDKGELPMSRQQITATHKVAASAAKTELMWQRNPVCDGAHTLCRVRAASTNKHHIQCFHPPCSNKDATQQDRPLAAPAPPLKQERGFVCSNYHNNNPDAAFSTPCTFDTLFHAFIRYQCRRNIARCLTSTQQALQ